MPTALPRAVIAATLVLTLAAPAAAHDREAPRGDSWVYSEDNSYYRDYLDDLSEARRELRSDMARAKTAQDRREAQQEYRREVADARFDFRKQMAEKGYAVSFRRGTVTVIE